ncbi:MAG TPA: hypothetical protein VK154_17460 [Chitinophagales bacterium]|nr:hypothetical protein [Chitinophagales bacterium]
MKKIFQITAFAFIMLTGMFSNAQVSVNVNIGAQPVWGPVGYDYARYYYMPEYDIYYDVPARRYVYLDGNKWLFAAALPPRYANVNVYNTYKVVLTEPRAYMYHKDHKVKYVKYKGEGGQVIIKNSNEPKYYVVKGHPHYAPPGQVKKSVKVSNTSQPRSYSKSSGNAPSQKSHGNGGGNKGDGKHGGGKGKGH